MVTFRTLVLFFLAISAMVKADEIATTSDNSHDLTVLQQEVHASYKKTKELYNDILDAVKEVEDAKVESASQEASLQRPEQFSENSKIEPLEISHEDDNAINTTTSPEITFLSPLAKQLYEKIKLTYWPQRDNIGKINHLKADEQVKQLQKFCDQILADLSEKKYSLSQKEFMDCVLVVKNFVNKIKEHQSDMFDDERIVFNLILGLPLCAFVAYTGVSGLSQSVKDFCSLPYKNSLMRMVALFGVNATLALLSTSMIYFGTSGTFYSLKILCREAKEYIYYHHLKLVLNNFIKSYSGLLNAYIEQN